MKKKKSIHTLEQITQKILDDSLYSYEGKQIIYLNVTQHLLTLFIN